MFCRTKKRHRRQAIRRLWQVRGLAGLQTAFGTLPGPAALHQFFSALHETPGEASGKKSSSPHPWAGSDSFSTTKRVQSLIAGEARKAQSRPSSNRSGSPAKADRDVAGCPLAPCRSSSSGETRGFRGQAGSPLWGTFWSFGKNWIVESFPGRCLETRNKRKYRKTKKSRGPRWWLTRPDPFANVRDDIKSWLDQNPERTGKSILQEPQNRYPGQYKNGQIRTLQRRVQSWRAQALITFNDEWIYDEQITGLPNHLRGETSAYSLEEIHSRWKRKTMLIGKGKRTWIEARSWLTEALSASFLRRKPEEWPK